MLSELITHFSQTLSFTLFFPINWIQCLLITSLLLFIFSLIEGINLLIDASIYDACVLNTILLNKYFSVFERHLRALGALLTVGGETSFGKGSECTPISKSAVWLSVCCCPTTFAVATTTRSQRVFSFELHTGLHHFCAFPSFEYLNSDKFR